MDLGKDFKEFIESLNEHKVKYLVVGGYAVAFHGYPRYTKDLDIWVYLEEGNAGKVIQSLAHFGFPVTQLSKQDFLDPDAVIQLGYPPNRIDILTDLEELSFEACFQKREVVDIGECTINFIDVESLVKTKRATGRPQDLVDADKLDKSRKKEE